MDGSGEPFGETISISHGRRVYVESSWKASGRLQEYAGGLGTANMRMHTTPAHQPIGSLRTAHPVAARCVPYLYALAAPIAAHRRGVGSHRTLTQSLRRIWQVQQGLPQGPSIASSRPADGFPLARAPSEASCRFDGASRFMATSDRGGHRHPEIPLGPRSACEDRDHQRLWVATDGRRAGARIRTVGQGLLAGRRLAFGGRSFGDQRSARRHVDRHSRRRGPAARGQAPGASYRPS